MRADGKVNPARFYLTAKSGPRRQALVAKLTGDEHKPAVFA
jgi:hypothetical protein